MSAAYPLSGAETKLIRKETLKAMAQGTVPPMIAMYFLFSDFPMALWGSDGFGAFQFKNSFGMAAVMTLLMSLGLRAARAKGTLPSLGWTRTEQPLLRLIPRNLLLRALLFAVADMALIGSLFFAIATILVTDGIEHIPFILFMGCQCAVNALFLAPLILVGVMTDPIAERPKEKVQA